MKGFFQRKGNLQSGAKEHNKDTPCNKRNVLGKRQMAPACDQEETAEGWAERRAFIGFLKYVQ